MNIGSFMGVWPIKFATGPLTVTGGALANLGSIEIGTDTNGASKPTCSGDNYEVQVGFALLDQWGGVIVSSDSGPLLSLVGEQLQWNGLYGTPKQELNINIALAEIFREGDPKRYPYVFGCTVYGDPDQVGVWGGSGMPGGGQI